jgi:hypothetical protein
MAHAFAPHVESQPRLHYTNDDAKIQYRFLNQQYPSHISVTANHQHTSNPNAQTAPALLSTPPIPLVRLPPPFTFHLHTLALNRHSILRPAPLSHTNPTRQAAHLTPPRPHSHAALARQRRTLTQRLTSPTSPKSYFRADGNGAAQVTIMPRCAHHVRALECKRIHIASYMTF